MAALGTWALRDDLYSEWISIAGVWLIAWLTFAIRVNYLRSPSCKFCGLDYIKCQAKGQDTRQGAGPPPLEHQMPEEAITPGSGVR